MSKARRLRTGDEPLPASLRNGYNVAITGPNILELLWRELQDQTGKLLTIDSDVKEPQDYQRYHAQRGHCLGLAKAIAIMTNPYDPDVDAVRREVMERINATD